MPLTSEPAPGSVTPTATIFLPAMTSGMKRCFNSSESELYRCTDAMSVWTSTVIATPENVDRPSSSASTTVANVSMSEPPYSSE